MPSIYDDPSQQPQSLGSYSRVGLTANVSLPSPDTIESLYGKVSAGNQVEPVTSAAELAQRASSLYESACSGLAQIDKRLAGSEEHHRSLLAERERIVDLINRLDPAPKVNI